VSRITDSFDERYDNQYQVPRPIMHAVHMVENGGRVEDARDGVTLTKGMHAGTRAIGAFQIMPKTAAGLGVTDLTRLHDWSVNKDLAARVLSENYRRTGSWPKAIEMYNGTGPAAQQYAQQVMGHLGPLAGMAFSAPANVAAMPDASNAVMQGGGGFGWDPNPAAFNQQIHQAYAPYQSWAATQMGDAAIADQGAQENYDRVAAQPLTSYAGQTTPRTSLAGVGLGSVFNGIASALSGNPEYLQNFHQEMGQQQQQYHEELMNAQRTALMSAHDRLEITRQRLEAAGNLVAAAKVGEQQAKIAATLHDRELAHQAEVSDILDARKSARDALIRAGIVWDPSSGAVSVTSKPTKGTAMDQKDYYAAQSALLNSLSAMAKSKDGATLAKTAISRFLTTATMQGDNIQDVVSRIGDYGPAIQSAMHWDQATLDQFQHSMVQEAIREHAMKEVRGVGEVSGALDAALKSGMIKYSELPADVQTRYPQYAPKPESPDSGTTATNVANRRPKAPAPASPQASAPTKSGNAPTNDRPTPPSYVGMDYSEHTQANVQYLEDLLQWHDMYTNMGAHVAFPDGMTRDSIQKELRGLRKEQEAERAKKQQEKLREGNASTRGRGNT